MTEPIVTSRTRVLLSFSGAYVELARRIRDDLGAANIEVRLDQWAGGGGAPAIQSVPLDLDDVRFVAPLLTPSDAAATWIGEEWKQAIHDKALAQKLEVLPVRGEGDGRAIPGFLKARSYADVSGRDYASGLRRLIAAIRELSGDTRIVVPDDGVAGEAGGSPAPLPPEPVVLELGSRLASILSGDASRRFADEIAAMVYDGLFYELGVRVPQMHMRTTSGLPPSSFRIVINDVPDAQFEARDDSVLVNERVAVLVEAGFAAAPAVNPATRADCAWIPSAQAEAATARGLTTWDTQQFVILALSAVLRRKAADFIGIDETQALLQQLAPVFPQLVAETVPKTVPLFVLTDVLRRLVAEIVSIRNMRRILLALADWGRVERDPQMLTEYVRAALHRQLTYQFGTGTNRLVVLLLHPDIEATIRNSTRHTATGSYLELEPPELRRILDAIHEPMDKLPNDAVPPVILTTMEIRSAVRRLVAPSLPRLHVMSYQELRPNVDIQSIGRISLDGFHPRRGVSVGGAAVWDA